MSDLWDRMTEAADFAHLQGVGVNGKLRMGVALAAALTVAAESDEDAFIERLGLVAIGDIADVLLSLAATGGNDEC